MIGTVGGTFVAIFVLGYLSIAHCLPCKVLKYSIKGTKCCCKLTAKTGKKVAKISKTSYRYVVKQKEKLNDLRKKKDQEES